MNNEILFNVIGNTHSSPITGQNARTMLDMEVEAEGKAQFGHAAFLLSVTFPVLFR